MTGLRTAKQPGPGSDLAATTTHAPDFRPARAPTGPGAAATAPGFPLASGATP